MLLDSSCSAAREDQCHAATSWTSLGWLYAPEEPCVIGILLLGVFGLVSPNGTVNVRLVYGLKAHGRIIWLHLRFLGRNAWTLYLSGKLHWIRGRFRPLDIGIIGWVGCLVVWHSEPP